jgi:uncharacterized lipoprotein
MSTLKDLRFLRRHPVLTAAFLAVVMMFLSACDSVRKGWDETQDFYKSYITLGPEVDLYLQGYYGKEQ